MQCTSLCGGEGVDVLQGCVRRLLAERNRARKVSRSYKVEVRTASFSPASCVCTASVESEMHRPVNSMGGWSRGCD